MVKQKSSEENIEKEDLKDVKKTSIYGKLGKYKLGFFAFSLLAIFVLFFINVKVANPSDIPFYNFKRLGEKVQLRLKSNPQDRLNYQNMLLDRRLTELIYIVERGISPYVLTTSLRYSTTAGQVTELVINNNLKDESQKTKEKLENQLLVVKDLPQKYPESGDEVKFIVDDANYLINYIDLLSSFSDKDAF